MWRFLFIIKKSNRAATTAAAEVKVASCIHSPCYFLLKCIKFKKYEKLKADRNIKNTFIKWHTQKMNEPFWLGMLTFWFPHPHFCCFIRYFLNDKIVTKNISTATLGLAKRKRWRAHFRKIMLKFNKMKKNAAFAKIVPIEFGATRHYTTQKILRRGDRWLTKWWRKREYEKRIENTRIELNARDRSIRKEYKKIASIRRFGAPFI